jgi:hypothetical protein
LHAITRLLSKYRSVLFAPDVVPEEDGERLDRNVREIMEATAPFRENHRRVARPRFRRPLIWAALAATFLALVTGVFFIRPADRPGDFAVVNCLDPASGLLPFSMRGSPAEGITVSEVTALLSKEIEQHSGAQPRSTSALPGRTAAELSAPYPASVLDKMAERYVIVAATGDGTPEEPIVVLLLFDRARRLLVANRAVRLGGGTRIRPALRAAASDLLSKRDGGESR